MSKESFHEESFSENGTESLENQPLYPAPMSDAEIQSQINGLAESTASTNAGS